MLGDINELTIEMENRDFENGDEFEEFSTAEIENVPNINKTEAYKGATFKNYKEFCSKLGIPYKTGSGKNKQLQQLQTYFFDYKKEGHKIIITKLHNLNDMQIRARTLRNNYSDYIEEIILSLMVEDIKEKSKKDEKMQSGSKELIISRTGLAHAISLVNKNYMTAISSKGSFCKIADVDRDIFEDWYKSVSNFIKNQIEKAISKLRDKRLIIYENRITVGVFSTSDIDRQIDRDGNEHLGFKSSSRKCEIHLATHQEKTIISKVENDILTEMGFTFFSDIYKTRGRKGAVEYREKVNERLAKDHNIGFYFNSYALSFSTEVVERYTSAMNIDFSLTKRARVQYEKEMNKLVVEKLDRMAIGRRDRASRKLKEGITLSYAERIREKDTYSNKCIFLNNNLMNISCKRNYQKAVKNRVIENRLIKEEKELEEILS